MSKINVNQLIEILEPRLKELGLTRMDIDRKTSLLEQGILDSISFLEFMMDIESKFNIELDFSELDPSEFTSIDKILKLTNNEN